MAVTYDQPNIDEIWWTKCRAALNKFGTVMTRSKYREIVQKFGCPLDVLLVSLPQQTRRVAVEQGRRRTRSQTRVLQPVPLAFQRDSAWGRRRGHSPPRRRRERNAQKKVRDSCIAKQHRRRHVSTAHGHRRSHRKGRTRDQHAGPAAASPNATRRARRRRAPSPPTITLVADEEDSDDMAMAPEAETIEEWCQANNGTEEVDDTEEEEEEQDQERQQDLEMERQQQTKLEQHRTEFPVEENRTSLSQHTNRELSAMRYEEHPSSGILIHGNGNPGTLRRKWPSPWNIDSNEIIESANITFTCPDITVREGKDHSKSRILNNTYEMNDLKKIDVILPPIPFQMSDAFESLSVESWTVYPVPSDHRGILELDPESGYVDVESLDIASPSQSSEDMIDPNLRYQEDMNEDYSQGIVPYTVPDAWCDSCREHAVPTSKIFSLAKQCRWPKWINSILGYMGLNSSGT